MNELGDDYWRTIESALAPSCAELKTFLHKRKGILKRVEFMETLSHPIQVTAISYFKALLRGEEPILD